MPDADTSQQLHEAALNTVNLDELNKAVRQAVKDEFEVTQSWSKQDVQFVIECPSGQKCLAKRLTTLKLLESNLLDEIDYFSRKLFPAQVDASGNPIDAQEDSNPSISKVLQDREKKSRFFGLLDRLLNISIVKPKVVMLPSDINIDDYLSWEGPELPPGQVWANVVDFGDKMFIFGELNKPLDEIKPFRIEQETNLANMAAMEAISRAPE